MNEKDDDVEIVSPEDEKIKLIGEIFSNDTSRKILKLLANNEMTANEIAQTNNMSLALVTHHLKRMQTANMVKVSKTTKSVKGQDMKYYITTKKAFLITPPKKTSQIIVNEFKKFSKFAAIGLAGLVSWMMVKPNGDNLQIMPIHQTGQGSFTSGERTTVDTENKWSSAQEQSGVDEDKDLAVSEPEVRLEVKDETATQEPESEPSHSGVQEFDYSELADEVAANTGSVSLDRTVYPVPWSSAGTEAIDPFIFSILVPVIVVGLGILVERLLTRWYNKRKAK